MRPASSSDARNLIPLVTRSSAASRLVFESFLVCAIAMLAVAQRAIQRAVRKNAFTVFSLINNSGEFARAIVFMSMIWIKEIWLGRQSFCGWLDRFSTKSEAWGNLFKTDLSDSFTSGFMEVSKVFPALISYGSVIRMVRSSIAACKGIIGR